MFTRHHSALLVRLIGLMCLLCLALLPALTAAQPFTPDAVDGSRPEEKVTGSGPATHEKSFEWTREAMLEAQPYSIEAVEKATSPDSRNAPSPGKLTIIDGRAPTAPEAISAPDPLQTTGDAPVLTAFSSGVLHPSYYSTYPFSTMGKVFFRDSTGTRYVCSASVAGNNAVWTAGHCVFDPDTNRWHYDWIFVPGYYDGYAPNGYWYARELWALNGWINDGNLGYDIGMAVLYRDGAGRSVATRFGWLGWMANYSRSQTWTSFGYPAGYPFNGNRIAWCQDPLRRIDYSLNPATNGMGCNMTGGSSGGPWLVNYAYNSTSGNYVNGVNSYKYNSDANTMYSPYFGNGAINIYNTVIGR